MSTEKRGRGRPRLSEPSIRVTMSFQPQFLRDLDTMCAFSGKSRSQVVQDVISANYEVFLDSLEKYPEMMAIVQRNTKDDVKNVLVVPVGKGGVNEG